MQHSKSFLVNRAVIYTELSVFHAQWKMGKKSNLIGNNKEFGWIQEKAF